MDLSKEKSVIPVKHGFPNPCYGQALNLIRHAAEYRELALRIRAEAAKVKDKNGKLNMKELFQQCADRGVKEDLRALFLNHTRVPKEDPVMGPPPATNQLYGRFGKGVSIVDVGSGNCMKLHKSSGTLSITAVDPELMNLNSLVLTPVKLSLRGFLDITPDWPERIFTSFMALPQIPVEERAPILNCDGLHVIPDHAMLVKNRIALVREDGTISVRTGVRDYVDYPVDMGGITLEPGYLLTPTYKLREIQIDISQEIVKQEYSPIIDAKPVGFYDLNFADLGPKFDGVAHELEASEGVVYLVDRGGSQRIGSVDVPFHFCLHLEEMDSFFVLIRVVSYRGMVPPHHGDSLRYFCDRVRLFINEKPVLASPRWTGGSFEQGPLMTWERGGQRHEVCAVTDGVISREEEKDRYCKYMWTVDIDKGRIKALTDALQDAGYTLTIRGDFPDGLVECQMTRNLSEVVLRPIKPRVDKRIQTSTDTVLYLVDRPTLSETELITGSYVTV